MNLEFGSQLLPDDLQLTPPVKINANDQRHLRIVVGLKNG